MAVHRVAGGRGRPAADGAGLADAFFEDLAVGRLAVAQQRADVLGLVGLAAERVDADLLEQVGHAEGARLVGDDRHDARAELLVLEQVGQHAHEGHRRAHLLAVGLQRERRRTWASGGTGTASALRRALRQAAAERGAARVQVAHLGAVVGRLEELERRGLLVGQRQVEAVAEGDQVVALELLLLVRRHAALAGAAHAVALLGLRQDHGRLAAAALRRRGRRRGSSPGRGRRASGGRSARRSGPGPARRAAGSGRRSGRGCSGRPWRRRSGTGRRRCWRRLAPARRRCRARTAPSQSEPQTSLMTRQPAPANRASSSSMMRPLPRTGPSSRCRLQLTTQIRLSSFSRAASVSALMLSGSSISPSPNTPQTLRAAGVEQPAVLQVAHEARLVDRADRTDAHRAGRELPEVGHQPGMRVAAQPLRTGLPAPISCR